jgi:signal transduction histidine kinase
VPALGPSEPDDGESDPRVLAVLEVLSGQPAPVVARRWAVDDRVLKRWVRDFVSAGTAQVTNTPEGNEAQQRDRFLAAFAHEVRTPLATAQGWMEMLADDDLPAGMRVTAVDRVTEALERLASRTAEVQLLATASMGRLSVNPTLVPVKELVDRVPGTTVQPPELDVDVCVDADLFARIIRDLWEAAHHDPAPRSVRLVVDVGDRWVEFRVERDADPIDTEILQALFEPFDLNDDATGITIGLYLARALAVAHKGTIGMEQDDRGAALWVRVPVHAPSTSRPPEEN